MTKSGLPTSLSRSQASNPKRTISLTESASPIAADGGFGPMNDEQSEDERSDSIDEDTEPNAEINTSEGIGDDFDDFEAGAEDDDFGDFDEGFQQSSSFEHEYSAEQSPESRNKSLPQLSPFVSKTRGVATSPQNCIAHAAFHLLRWADLACFPSHYLISAT